MRKKPNRLTRYLRGPASALRQLLSLDDSPHAVALGACIGIFLGLTPTVGIQTILVIILVLLTRRFLYFNRTAALLATYISNPVTALPLYYGLYRVGLYFVPGRASRDQFAGLLQFEGIADWWQSVVELCTDVGGPLLAGTIIVAPLGAVIAYPTVYFLFWWVHRQWRITGSAGDSVSAAAAVSRDDDGASTPAGRGEPGESSGKSPVNDEVNTAGTDSGSTQADAADGGARRPQKSAVA